MTFLLSYLFKFSVSLAGVYLFYRLGLRRLTFYNWNRFYLLCYTALSIFIPFVNITPVLQRHEITDNRVIRFIPAVGNLDPAPAGNLSVKIPAAPWTTADWWLIFVITGIVVMGIRLVMQLASFRKIKNHAELVSDMGDVKLYQVNKPIIPFSFGNSIFINRQLHNGDELNEIVRHEFVHVKQRHSADIIWSELLCILNWYNPFAWLIRRAIRQNLEFIADDKLLQSGIDKKQYQYLLLKVIGNNHFSIASQFNFSSLKKRIAMMNKMKSARIHLLKFLFVLPLIAVLILAFRSRVPLRSAVNGDLVFSISGIVYDNETELPLPGVLMVETAGGIQARTDNNGFYVMDIPVKDTASLDIDIKLSKEGYISNDRRMMIEFKSRENRSSIALFSLLNKVDVRERLNNSFFCSTNDEKGNVILHPDYAFVKQKFENFFDPRKKEEESGSLAGHADRLRDKARAEQPLQDVKLFSIEDVQLDVLYVLNEKGYYLELGDNKGKCNVVVRDKHKKEVKRLLLTEWNKKKEYYQALYGKIPPFPAKATAAIEGRSEAGDAVTAVGAVNTIETVTTGDTRSSAVSLTPAKKGESASGIEKTEVAPAADLANARVGTTFRDEANDTRPTEVTGGTTLSPVDANNAAPDIPVQAGSTTLSPVKEVRVERVLILEVSDNMSEVRIRQQATAQKSKGYDFNFSKIEYRDGKLVLLKGTIRANGRTKNFSVSDFKQFSISDVAEVGGKKELNFNVAGGSLFWD